MIILPRLLVRLEGSTNPMQASTVDVWGPAPARFYIGRLGKVAHATGRRWHYPEPGGGESDVSTTHRAFLRSALAEDPRTAALVRTL